ncbi:response regulator [Nocardioides sp. CN2-186]|uniref:response regulator n=1 Tax=Nocardioides tweenelious TaxID=3156607 RepID=UPI0032B3C9E6
MVPGPGDAASVGSPSDWILQAAPDGLWVLDDAGITTWANRRLADLLGLAEDEVVGFPAVEALDEDGRTQFLAHLERLRTAREAGADLECLLVRRDGSQFWALVSHAPIVDGAGEHRGWLHRVRDHSEQRAELLALERRERELAEAQSISHIGSWERLMSEDVLHWSDELYEVLGVDPGSIPPTVESFAGLLHPDDRQAVRTAYVEMVAAGKPVDVDARLDRPVGEPTRWVRIQGRVAFDDDGELVRLSGTVQDVTETKEAEQGLAFLSAMAGAANEARTLQDALLASDTIVRPYTQWPAIVVSAPDRDNDGALVHFDAGWREYAEPELAFARRLAEEVAADHLTVQRLRDDGIYVVAGPALVGDRLACVIVSDTRSAMPPRAYELAIFHQMLNLLASVAEREEADRELATARDEALAASRAKSDFLATMSHEIRTPLNGVIGLSELLNRTELSPHQRRLSQGVDQAGRSLLSLVNDILDLSKVEAGRLDLEEIEFDPRTIVEQSVSLVSERAVAKDLELLVSSVDNLPPMVTGDPVRFGQVVTNLLSNAVKFTQAGEVVVRASGAGSTVRIEVSDTGIGITPDVQRRLFSAFTQGDSSTTREYGGTGLGLAISKRIVEAMGGTIGVRSEEGSGSTFWFTVPFGTATGPQPQTARRDSVAGLRVLVVDDNATNRFILDEQLTAWSVDVTTVESAYDALIELDASVRHGHRYDVALLDYMMPTTDGEELARLIRAESRHRGTRLALLSSGLEPSPEWLEAAGIDGFIAKPVLASSLLDELAVLGGRYADEDPASTVVDAPPTGEIRGRLLVVEDNAVNQLVATGILRGLGFDLVLAENGAVAIAMLADEPEGFDAVLMDCQMPVMDGFDATRAIRAMGGSPATVPIIAMTASATADERQRCRDAGMDDFVSKPVVPAVLESTLDRWLPSGRSAPTASADAAAPVSASEKRLRELVEDGFDAELVLKIIGRFGDGADRTLAELRDAVTAGDAPVAAERAHRLRGSALNVGLVDLAVLCQKIEERARVGELPDPDALASLGVAVTAAVAELDRARAWLE